MIESIEFTNFKALRKTVLPLAPFTLLLGPNGSGKTSVLQALQAVAAGNMDRPSVLSIMADGDAPVEIKLRLREKNRLLVASFKQHKNQTSWQFYDENGKVLGPNDPQIPMGWLQRMQTFALDSVAIAQPVPVNSVSLAWNGAGLAAVLDDLRDNHLERWELLVAELRRWLPEYDQIQFDKPNQGHKGIVLRTRNGRHRIPARDLSQGTLVALALLTLAYLPNPPSLIGLEEIDRGLHPRLLRHLQDALYRLCYPESCGERRQPIQVIATTHSPYMLDLYRDNPQEVILADKDGLEAKMKRLSDIEHYQEILAEAPLSEVWYSGVLGGVSVKP
jgi:predicted ATPase